jgi:hypothetical protein
LEEPPQRRERGRRKITYITTADLILAVCNYDSKSQPGPVDGSKPRTLTCTDFPFPLDTVGWMPGQAVDDFNEIMNGTFGFWETGWVHMGGFYGDLTFWRDLRGYRICSNPNGGYMGK